MRRRDGRGRRRTASTTEWNEVADFVDSGAGRPPLRVGLDDRRGPLRAADPLPRRHDAASTARSRREGALIVVTGYRYGGGAAGNVGAGDAHRLRTSLPYVDRRREHRAGDRRRRRRDGRERQAPRPAVAARRRAGRHRRRLRAAGRARPTRRSPGCAACRRSRPAAPIRLLVVPARRAARRSCCSSTTSPCPTTWSQRVSEHLDERRILGTAIEIGTPFYQGVTVAALLDGPARPARRRSCASGRWPRCTATSTR